MSTSVSTITGSERLQGIGSILGCEPERPKTAGASLRRTLSADMSSKKWLGRHGFTPLKKIPSSESLSIPVASNSSSSSSSWSSSSSSSSSSEDEDEDQQKKKKKKKEDIEQPGMSDIWGSILSQKADPSSKSSSASAYIHPLVKRSKSSLSQKSLEICTESLGSETGSEGFNLSSFPPPPPPPSETVDFKEKSAETEELLPSQSEIRKSSSSTTRSFPPPLPSLARREGPGFLMQSHRRDGRLVLEAVPVPSYNYFQAQRQGGRLLLSFINKPSEEEELELEEGEEEEADVFDEFQGFEEEEETEKVERENNNGVQVRRIVTEIVKSSSQPTLMTAILTNKLMGLTNKNPTWSSLKEEEEEEEEEELMQLPRSLPCPPRMARLMPSPALAATAAASFNAYDYFWRTKPTAAAAAMTQQPPLPPPIIDNNNKYYRYSNKIVISDSKVGVKPQEQQRQMLDLRGNEADCLVPSMRVGCKDPRCKSLFIWQNTSCIATS